MKSNRVRSRARVLVHGGIRKDLLKLGLQPGDDRATKAHLAVVINKILGEAHLSQASAAEVLGISQPKVSALANFKLDGFSVERLLTFLNALGRDIEITIRKRRFRGEPRILVLAA